MPQQTRRRRKTKHRGNAAGMIESRGRTGRKPTSAEKSGAQAGATRTQQKPKVNRLDRPPTWKGAFYRSLIAAVVMLVMLFALLGVKNPADAIAIFPIMLAMYVPMSYYTDLWMYRRRQRQKAAARAAGKTGRA